MHDDIGITYQIGLKELINRQILSKPTFESYYTDEEYGNSLGLDAWESIQHLDTLPDDIVTGMNILLGSIQKVYLLVITSL